MVFDWMPLLSAGEVGSNLAPILVSGTRIVSENTHLTGVRKIPGFRLKRRVEQTHPHDREDRVVRDDGDMRVIGAELVQEAYRANEPLFQALHALAGVTELKLVQRHAPEDRDGALGIQDGRRLLCASEEARQKQLDRPRRQHDPELLSLSLAPGRKIGIAARLGRLLSRKFPSLAMSN